MAFITWCAALANNTHCHAEALRAGVGGGRVADDSVHKRRRRRTRETRKRRRRIRRI